MDIDLQVLNQITKTAVDAAGMRDYDINPLLKRHLRSDGTFIETQIAAPSKKNELLDLESCVDIHEQCLDVGGGNIFVGKDAVFVTHDDARVYGYSFCKLRQSETIKFIYNWICKDIRPEEFEKIARLYFGADSQFINRLRRLRWEESTDKTTRLSNVSKSADMQTIARVVDDEEILFQDISLLVRTPYFVLPYETKTVEIELDIIACANTKTISFAPKPGVMMRAEHEAVNEVLSEVNRILGKDEAIIGEPKM